MKTFYLLCGVSFVLKLQSELSHSSLLGRIIAQIRTLNVFNDFVYWQNALFCLNLYHDSTGSKAFFHHNPIIDFLFFFFPFSILTNKKPFVFRNAQAPPARVPCRPGQPELPARSGAFHSSSPSSEQRRAAAADQPKRAAHRSVWTGFLSS